MALIAVQPGMFQEQLKHTNMDHYTEFIALLNQLSHDEIGVSEFVVDVKELLLRDHAEMLIFFNMHLPLSYKMIFKEDYIGVDEMCTAFYAKIQARNINPMYRKWKQTMARYQVGITTAHESCREVEKLFENHIDLWKEFELYFMPEDYVPTSSTPQTPQRREKLPTVAPFGRKRRKVGA